LLIYKDKGGRMKNAGQRKRLEGETKKSKSAARRAEKVESRE
jgi:hypothetical protein